jgi:transcriptional regulator with XRE-family HTH domain
MKKNIRQTVGERLAEARREHGMTQRDLAAHLDVWADRVHRWERGTSRPHRSSAAAIADLLGIPVSAWDDTQAEASTPRRRVAA